jgi:hypothetical protein
MQAPRDNDADVRGQHSVAGDHMGLRLRMRTDLAGQRERGYPLGEAARDGDGRMPVSLDQLRRKKTGGASPSAQHR